MGEKVVYDPVELVKDLADKIGIHQLYAIAKDMRGEGGECRDDELAKKLTLIEADNQWLKDRVCRLEGEIDGLKFAIKCNGISGAEVR
jgi:hypothetical protein